MTLSSTTVKDDYNGDGSTTDFATTFVFWNSSELKVILTSSSGVETTWTEGTEYDVTGGSGAVGTVSASTTGTDYTPDTGETLRIKSNVLDIQETSLPAGGAFPSTSVEQELDRTVRRIQQQEEQFDRASLLSEASTFTGLTMPDPVANAYVVFNSDGDDLTTTSTAQSQWLGGDGTVSLPYYSFSADPDTGVYRIGANNLGIAVGGAKALDIDASGINGVIGATTAAAGTFTNITATGGSITGITDLAVADGGTGASTLTDGGVLLGSGTGAITAMSVLADGEMVVGDGAGDPVAESGATLRTSIGVGAGDSPTFTDLTLSGDLTVNGTTVTLNTTNLAVEDNLIELQTGSTTANANDMGIVMERGTTGDNAFMGWDESTDEFVVATTTNTGTDTGNLTLTDADLRVAALTCSSGTIAGVTSFGLQTGATITAGILDEDAMGSDSAVALATQQSIKAYVDASVKAPGIQMTWDSATADSDQGTGTVWANNATLSSATVLYFDDVANDSTSINALIDTLDDPTATNSAYIYIQEAGSGTAGVVFKVSGDVTSASTYSKVAVTHVATFGTLADADVVGVIFSFSADNGDALLANDNTWGGAQRPTVTTLTSSSGSIAIDFDDSNDFSHTFTENTTLANPSATAVAGQSGSIYLTQASTAAYTLAFGSEYDFVGGTAVTVTATAAARDRLDYVVRADGQVEVVGTLNYS